MQAVIVYGHCNVMGLIFSRPKRFTLKGYKRNWFVCKDLQLFVYKTREEVGSATGLAHKIQLRGCEVTPDVNLSQDKFGIRLEVPGPDGMSEMLIRCDSVSDHNGCIAHCATLMQLKTKQKNIFISNLIFFLSSGKPIRQMDGRLSPSSQRQNDG